MPNFVRSLTVIVAVVLSLCAPVAAYATPQVDQTQSLTTGGSGGPLCSFMGPMSINDAAGTTFTAGITGSLTSIDIPLLWIYTSDNLQVSIYATSSGRPTGSALAVQIISPAALASVASGGTLSVTFTSPATVQSGTGYAFVLDFPSCSSSAQASMATVTSVPGRAFIYKQGSAAWNSYAPTGINFTTYVEAPAPQNTPSATPSVTTSPSATPAGQLANTGSDLVEATLLWGSLGTVFLGLGAGLNARHNTRRSSTLKD